MFDATMWAQIWSQVALVLFLALVIYLGAPKFITKALDERAAKIAAELDAAKKLRDEAQALLSEYQKKRKEAEAEAQAAREAEIAASGSLSDAEQADQMAESAKQANKVAKAAEKAASTGLGLRTTYRAELTDPKAAIAHYWAARREDFIALVTDLAAKDVRAGKREIPGFTIHAEQKAF